METRELLKHLISFPTISSESNLNFIHYVQGLFDDYGIQSQLVKNTEGGLFSQHLNTPVVVCGPGSIEQAHKPNEFIKNDQLSQCDELLRRIITNICFLP